MTLDLLVLFCAYFFQSKFASDDQVGAPLHDLIMLPRHCARSVLLVLFLSQTLFDIPIVVPFCHRGVFGYLCPTLSWAITKPLISPLVDPRGPTKSSAR